MSVTPGALRGQQPVALVACCADPSVNPRPNRAIKLLAAMGYRVVTLSYPLSQPMPEVAATLVHSRRSLWRGLGRRAVGLLMGLLTLLRLNSVLPYRVWTWRLGASHLLEEIRVLKPSRVVCHDFSLLPLCLQARAESSRLIFDAREFYPKEFEASWWFRNTKGPETARILQWAIPLVDGFCTVSDGLASEYLSDFGRKPVVIRSAPPFRDAQPTPVDPGRIRLVHHGVANRARSLEEMIDIARKLDARFTLDFYLAGDQAYVQTLRRYAKDVPSVGFKEPVRFADIHPMLRAYDIGFFFLKPQSLNTSASLPNKFFEFIQARLALAIGPSPDMRKVADEYGFAVVATSFSVQAMADALNSLTTEQVVKLKQRSAVAASALCWEVESEKLRALLEPA